MSTEPRLTPIDLDSLAEDFARELMRTHDIDADTARVRAALVPFLEAAVPGVLTDEQRIGLDLLRTGANDNPGVHESHCCSVHGCRYGYTDCPVKAGALAPEYPNNNGCELCEFVDADGEER